ncbi:IclR family acetate operon transcriptional repressor [Friedmanniella endophytica]|uniref:Glycerol operon regulatory protein n=1 Tax=Microlunatus kandeliicorticis TaxID=1759536 RepID=A0A7W3P6R3_9ACTN|nr:IclR family transcriptional regulator [Microlunatus kandeliicorticis]MBA8795222.1 IclR family acetate operon transcriptional repressor [Microlunatus kandeliicorticis]
MTTETATARSGSVQSVERAFELIEIIARAGGETTLSGLAGDAGLPLPTIHRLLRTLLALGYVRQLPNRRYALGARLIHLGEQAGQQIGTGTRPELQKLVADLGETANMAMLDQDMVVYVAQVPSPHAMRMFTEVGRRAHLHDTGVGKAILATLDDETVTELVTRAGMPTPTPKSHGDLDGLLADLARIRQRGYAIDDEEQELGVRCYSVAVPGAPTPMAISVSGPLTRVDLGFGDKAVPLLEAAAARIARALG